MGNTKGRSDYADVAGFDVFDDDVEAIEAGMQRNGFLDRPIGAQSRGESARLPESGAKGLLECAARES